MQQPKFWRPLGEEASEPSRCTRIFPITSATRGVGKTVISVNLATEFRRQQKSVLLLDCDPGTMSSGEMLGVSAQCGLFDLLEGKCALDDVFFHGPNGIDILPAGPLVEQMQNLSGDDRIILMERLTDIEGRYDYVLVDAGPGNSANVMSCNLGAHGTILVATPDGAKDSAVHSLINTLFKQHLMKRFHVLINQASSENEGRNAYRLLAEFADKHFGNVTFGYLGCLTRDDAVEESIRMHRAAVDQFPDSGFASQLRAIALRITGLDSLGAGMDLFWRRFFSGTPAEESFR